MAKSKSLMKKMNKGQRITKEGNNTVSAEKDIANLLPSNDKASQLKGTAGATQRHLRRNIMPNLVDSA